MFYACILAYWSGDSVYKLLPNLSFEAMYDLLCVLDFRMKYMYAFYTVFVLRRRC